MNTTTESKIRNSEIRNFDEYVKHCVDTGSDIIADEMIYVHNTKELMFFAGFTDTFIINKIANKSFIYNEEDHKCYFLYNRKLYKLSVAVEEVASEKKSTCYSITKDILLR